MDTAVGEKSLELTLAELRSKLLNARKSSRPLGGSASPQTANAAAMSDLQAARQHALALPTNGSHQSSNMQVDGDVAQQSSTGELAALKLHPLGKRMLEETSSSSSSSSDSEADRPMKRAKPTDDYSAPAPVEADDSEDEALAGSGIMTANEIEEADIAPPPIAEVPSEYSLLRAGIVESAIGNVLVVRADLLSDGRILDEGTLVCLENRTALGIIFETLGSIKEPRHTVRFPSPKDPLLLKAPGGTPVFFVDDADFSAFVYPEELRQQPKGSDASNIFDEEVAADEIEYSDDEQEAQAKRQQKQGRKIRAHSRQVTTSAPSHEPSVVRLPTLPKLPTLVASGLPKAPNKATWSRRDIPSEAEDGEVSDAVSLDKEVANPLVPVPHRMDAFSPPPDEAALPHQRIETKPSKSTAEITSQASIAKLAGMPSDSAPSTGDPHAAMPPNVEAHFPAIPFVMTSELVPKSAGSPPSPSSVDGSSLSPSTSIGETAPLTSTSVSAAPTVGASERSEVSPQSSPPKDRNGLSAGESALSVTENAMNTSASIANSSASRTQGGSSQEDTTDTSVSHRGPSKELQERYGLPARPKSLTPPYQDFFREGRDHYSPPPRRLSPGVKRRSPPVVDVGREESGRPRPLSPSVVRRHPGDFLDRYEPPKREVPRDFSPRDPIPRAYVPREYDSRDSLPLRSEALYDEYHRTALAGQRGLPLPPPPRRRSRSRSPDRMDEYRAGPPSDLYRDYRASGLSPGTPWVGAYPPSAMAPQYYAYPVDPYSPYAPGAHVASRNVPPGTRYGSYPDYPPPPSARGDYLYGDSRADPHGDRRLAPLPPPIRFDEYGRPLPLRPFDPMDRERDFPRARDYRDLRDLPPPPPSRERRPYGDEGRTTVPYSSSYTSR